MNEYVDRLARPLVTFEADLTQEFEQRLADCSTLAVRIAFSVLRSQQDAEDVAQEAFIRAHSRFARLRDRERFRPWLVRIVWRLSIDHRRRSRRRARREDAAASLAPATGHAERDVLADERRRRLWEAIDALPDKLRLPIILVAIDGNGIREVAELAGIPEGTVKSRLFEARKRLQERLR